MLRTSMIILATTAALTGGFTVDALARGGAAHMGGGFGGVHVGGGFGGAHIGGFGRGFTGQHLAGTRDHFGRGDGFHRGGGDLGLYDSGCGYSYYDPYAYNCYPSDY
jgi:hypothetical protein